LARSRADGEDAADPPSGLLVYQTGGVVDSLLFDFYGELQ